MHRSMVFAALLGGVGLGAWSSFSAPLRPPGLDFGALAVTLQKSLPSLPISIAQTETASIAQTTQPDANTPQSLMVNAAVSTSEPAIAVPALSPQPADFPISPEELAADACGPWSISEAGMETILREMVRRGWTPPSRSAALSVSQPVGLPPLKALDPDSPAVPILPEDEGDDGDRRPAREPTKFTN
jgi:hypothetical protein